MRGRVLEVGNGHAKRRGRFQPPVEGAEEWIFVDLHAKRDPDLQADMQSLPLTAASFDTVVCLEVLECVTSPTAALAYFPLTALSWLDRRVTVKHPVLFTFSTGYLVVAKAILVP